MNRQVFAETNRPILDDGTATRIAVESWMTPDAARDKYAGTFDWPVEEIRAQRAKVAGRSFHVGEGLWLMVCPDCDAETLTYGSLPIYYAIGPHMVAEHGAQVPGINVGILG